MNPLLYDSAYWIWRRLPERRRRDLFHDWTYRLARHHKSAAGFSKGPVFVCGPLNSINGIGWGARAELNLLSGADYDVLAYDLSYLLRAKDASWYPDRLQEQKPGDGGVVVFHLNPNVVPLSFLWLRKRFLRERYLVGFWTWEVDDLPPLWSKNTDLVHEIWTPSSYCAEILRKWVKVPVHTVPHPISVPAGVGRDRRRFTMPEKCFVVLAMCPVSSGLTRKNPIAAIEAFKRAFGDRSDALLVMKVSHAHRYPDRMAKIVGAIGDRTNIHLITETLSDQDTWTLLNSADAVISLHRAEGFGLVLAQAMALGKPVVATGWSGNADFMNDRNSCPVRYALSPVDDPEGTYTGVKTEWAEPDIDDAAQHLRRLSEDSELRGRIGDAAAKSIAAQYSDEAVLDALVQTGAASFFSPSKARRV